MSSFKLIGFKIFTLLTLCVFALKVCFSQQAAKLDFQGKQSIFSYESEGIGYSDIENVYSTDTIEKKQSFFTRRNLQNFTIKIHCGIKETFIKDSLSDNLVSFQLTDPVITLKNNNLLAVTNVLTREIANPLFARFTNEGLISTVQIDTSISLLASNILKAIINNFQNCIKNDKKEWECKEENSSGTYIAKYTLVKNDETGGAQYQKTNQGYTYVRSEKKNEKIITETRENIFTDSKHVINKLTVSEAQVVFLNGDTVSASGSQVNISLVHELLPSHTELYNLIKLLHSSKYIEVSTLSASIPDEKIFELSYANTLGNDNLETLSEKLKTSELNTKDKDRLISKFTALVYLHPENSKKMAVMLNLEAPGSMQFSILSQALATAEIPFSINALVDVIGERRKEDAVVNELLPYLTITKSPTDEAVNLIKQLSFDSTNSKSVRATSQLTLGGLAYNMRKINKEKSEEITKFILDKTSNEGDTLQKIIVLGNTGSPLIIPVLNSYIETFKASNNIRAAAVWALRLIESSEVDILLKNIAQNNNSVIARAAKETIEYRKNYILNQ